MLMSQVARKLAEEIVQVLHYNPQLTQDEKILAVQSRLNKLTEDVERACSEAVRRQKEDKTIIVDSHPQDIPVLVEAMLARQAERGPAN